MKHQQTGHASIEYVVVSAALAFALFVPIGGDAASPNSARTTLQIVLDELAKGYRKISHAISLPN
ncbi:MAG TPA: hypothetical protein VF774_14060 [Pseudoduganella sp.]|jgi:hypothetical protein